MVLEDEIIGVFTFYLEPHIGKIFIQIHDITIGRVQVHSALKRQ